MAHAQDFMGAAVRSGLADDDEWVARAGNGRTSALAAIDADTRALRIKEARCTSPRQEHAQCNPSRTFNAKLLLKLEGRKPKSGKESRGATDKRVQVSCKKGRAWVAPRVERLSRETHCASITSSPVDMRAVADAGMAMPSLSNADLGDGVHAAAAAARLRRSTAEPHQPETTRSGRTVHRTRPAPVHLNPVNAMLISRARAPAYF